MGLAHDISKLARTDDIRIEQSVTFDNMLLSSDTLKGLHKAGFNKPSPIQLHGVPLGKCGFDLLLEAKSGTGKTLVFSIIALEKICFDEGLQVIILTPTREIAAQVHDVISVIGSTYADLVVEVVMGGLPFLDDVLKFKKTNVHIVVGSPGRLRHLIQDKHINVTNIRLVVLDEADKLMEDSFQADVNYIFSTLPKQKQVIMSSATYPDCTKPFIDNYMRNAQHVCPNSSNVLIGISQKITSVKYNSNIVIQTLNKYKNLLEIITENQFKQCLVFCNYQVRVNEVYKLLKRDKWPVEKLYGQQDQCNRLNTLKTLKEFKCRILVSTDLAARGIDASNVDLVVNFEPPYDWVTYLHRIGRAGRYGSYGTAVTILSEGNEVANFKKLLAVVKGNLNISDFFAKGAKKSASEHMCSEANSENSLKVEDIYHSKIISHDSNKINDSEYVAKVWNINTSYVQTGQFETFHSLNSSFENLDKIDTFFDLMKSYEDIKPKDCSMYNYKIIDVKEYDQKAIESLNSVISSECDLLTNLTENNLNENKINSITQNKKQTVYSESRTHNNYLDKNLSENKNHCNLIRNEHNTYEPDLRNFTMYSHGDRDEFALYDLPSCFTSTKNKRRKIVGTIEKNKVYRIKEKHCHISPVNQQQTESETSSTTSNESDEDLYVTNCQDVIKKQEYFHEYKQYGSDVNIDGLYKSHHNHKKESKTHYENYLQWYKQLKFRIKHIEYAFYIEEMNK